VEAGGGVSECEFKDEGGRMKDEVEKRLPHFSAFRLHPSITMTDLNSINETENVSDPPSRNVA
jgi:hypothetical protein